MAYQKIYIFATQIKQNVTLMERMCPQDTEAVQYCTNRCPKNTNWPYNNTPYSSGYWSWTVRLSIAGGW